MDPSPPRQPGGEGALSAPSAGREDAEAASSALVRITGLSKAFGAVQALRDVDLSVHAGEVHALVGANGAGKSTVIRVLAGLVAPDSGVVELDGEPVAIRSPHHAHELGFAFLHQELNLVPKFNALENMSLGLVGRSRLGLADRRPTFAKARAVAQDIGFEFSLERAVGELPVAQQWLVALGRSLMRNARLIALDEPTASLSAKESEKLFEIIARMTSDGRAVLYVSHRLEEVQALSRQATAFRDGRVVARFGPGQITRGALIEAITGGVPEAVSVAPAETNATPGPVIVEAENLVRWPAVRGVSLQLRAGEIVGMAGLVGAGRTELARLLIGADRPEEGRILVDGRPVRLRSPAEANRLGIGLVPEERRSEGLFLDKDVTFNINIASAETLRVGSRFGFLSVRRARRQALELAERVDLRPLNVNAIVRRLSGGNQQKAVLGRWLVGRRRLLILDEPTRGIDIGARAQIHRMLRVLAEDGLSLLMISSDFEELLACDRVLVMHLGRIVEELAGPSITEERMLRAAYEAEPPEASMIPKTESTT